MRTARGPLRSPSIPDPVSAGFVDMQIETSALMDNVGTIPFLDYKHFAAKIFFPEVSDEELKRAT